MNKSQIFFPLEELRRNLALCVTGCKQTHETSSKDEFQEEAQVLALQLQCIISLCNKSTQLETVEISSWDKDS